MVVMEIRWIKDIEEYKSIRDDWDKALEASNADNPFLLSDLIITWWEHFGDYKELRIFVLYEDGQIVGGFPLYVNRLPLKYMKLRCLQQIGDGFANVTEPFYVISSGEFKKYFYNGLKIIKAWNFLDLPRLGISARNYQFKNDGFKVISVSPDTNPIIEIENDAESYIMSRGKNLRNNVRKARKKAKKIGDISLIKINNIPEIKTAYDNYIDYSVSSFSRRGKKSAYADKKISEFTLNLINAFALKNHIDAHILKFGDVTAAISFGYRFKKGFKWIFTSYNPELHNISPGHTLIFELINFSYKNNDPYYDMFAGGNVYYKQQWCNKFVPLYKVKIFNNNIQSNIGHILYKLYLKRNDK